VSASPASTNPQFATGPQKCVVLGPVSEFQRARSLLANEVAVRAAMLASWVRSTRLRQVLKQRWLCPGLHNAQNGQNNQTHTIYSKNSAC
jgi:hypothetical protein